VETQVNGNAAEGDVESHGKRTEVVCSFAEGGFEGGMERNGFGGRDRKFCQLFSPDSYYSDDLSTALITYIRRCIYIGTEHSFYLIVAYYETSHNISRIVARLRKS